MLGVASVAILKAMTPVGFDEDKGAPELGNPGALAAKRGEALQSESATLVVSIASRIE
jgi:hypothetical protein